MKAKDVRYWLNVHSKCRFTGDDENAAVPEDFEWCMKNVDIVMFCDEIAAAYESDLTAARDQLADKQTEIDQLQAAIEAKEEVHTEDFARLEGQLAEMREALGKVKPLRSALLWQCDACNDGDDFKMASCEVEAILTHMDQALSAAPAGRRVLFRRRIETDFDETIRFWEYDESGERRYVGELYEPIADWAFDFKPKILTITEAPPSADEE